MLKSRIEEDDVKEVVYQMAWWDMDKAYATAARIKGFPKKALHKLKSLKKLFGNCGIQSGDAYNQLRQGNNEVAKLLGYTPDALELEFEGWAANHDLEAKRRPGGLNHELRVRCPLYRVAYNMPNPPTTSKHTKLRKKATPNPKKQITTEI
jgi:hypothetical protein